MTVEEAAFEAEHGVPVNAGGSVVVAAWGNGVGHPGFIAVAFSALLLSYFYLRPKPQWPPPGIADPGVGRVILAAGLVVASGAVVRAALRRLRAADQRGFIAALPSCSPWPAAAPSSSLDTLGYRMDRPRLRVDLPPPGRLRRRHGRGGRAHRRGADAVLGRPRPVHRPPPRQRGHRPGNGGHGGCVVVGFGTLYLGPHLT